MWGYFMEIKLGLHLLYMKILLLFILCFVGLYTDAQIPTKYIGTWNLLVDYLGPQTLEINADSAIYKYYNPATKEYSSRAYGITFKVANNELVFSPNCGGMYFNSVKISDITDTKIRFDIVEKVKVDWTMMDWALGCLPFSGVLEKTKDFLPPTK